MVSLKKEEVEDREGDGLRDFTPCGRHACSRPEVGDRAGTPWEAVPVLGGVGIDPWGTVALAEASRLEAVACLSGCAPSLGGSHRSRGGWWSPSSDDW